jgi:hypothetical protein
VVFLLCFVCCGFQDEKEQKSAHACIIPTVCIRQEITRNVFLLMGKYMGGGTPEKSMERVGYAARTSKQWSSQGDSLDIRWRWKMQLVNLSPSTSDMIAFA